MPKKSIAEHSAEWFLLLKSVEEIPQDVGFLEALLLELRLVRETILKLEGERLALKAKSQQITKDMNALKKRGRSVAARVRSGLRTQLGYDSEQLTAHGMKPRRRKVAERIEEQEILARLADDSAS